MTFEELQAIDWKFGNKVRLDNGKEYDVIKPVRKGLLLHSEEYHAVFYMSHGPIVERTSEETKKRKRKRMTIVKHSYERV